MERAAWWHGRKVAALAMAATSSVAAQNIVPGYPGDVEGYDSREVGLLPAYCKHTQLFRARVPGGNDKTQIDGWHARLGPTFDALHHYCWGIMKTNRASYLALDETARRFYWAAANGEFDYVIERSPSDFVLLPEILTAKARNLVLLDKGVEAITHFERAIAAKADYWPPYAGLADYYRKANQADKAREVLEAGIQHNPNAKELQRRLGELNAAPRKTR